MKNAMAFAALFMAMAAIAAGPVTLTAKDGKSSQHETLQAALDAACDGATIKLESDLVCDTGLKIAKAVTIDLNGKTLTGTSGDFFRVVAPKTVTLMNGTYKHTAKGKSAICPNADGAVVEVKNCVVETVYACVWSPAAGTVNFDKTVIVDSFFIGNSGKARANLRGGSCVVNRSMHWSEDAQTRDDVAKRIGFFNAKANIDPPDDSAKSKLDYGALESAQFDLAKVEPISAVDSDVMPREGTNAVPLKGTSDFDVIRAGAAAFFGEAKVTKGTFSFSILGDGKRLWSSGLLKAGESKRFEVDVREFGIVTFSTWGDGAGVWDGLEYACNTKMWKGGDNLSGITPLVTYRESVIAKNQPWENPHIFAVNRCDSHVPIFSHDSVEAARKAKSRADSPWFMSLDGVWKVQWAPEPAKAPSGFESAAFDISSWPTVNVPESLECAGFGTAIFRNVGYYWTADPPFVSRPAPTNFLVHAEPNGTASYRRDFALPENWTSRRTFLRFDGFASAIDVWVNGKKLGYAQDGRQGAEFDVTDFVKAGRNTLAVRTYRLCDGSYMEDQDFYRLSGLIRPVFLRSEPEKRIRDFAVATVRASEGEPYAGGTWLLKVDADIPSDCKVELSLFDAAGMPVPVSQVAASPRLALRVMAPKLWSAEEPNLYRLVVALKDGSGRLLQAVPQNVGFREVVRRDSQILLNGQAILFKGVNRHEMDPDHGYAVPYERMVEDVKLMKRYNINGVRLSHYANDPRWYDLADEYGLYLVDEANLETHGCSYHGWFNHTRRQNPLARVTGGARNPVIDPRFRAAALDRDRGMVMRDKNHPSVVIWSLGNENMVAWSDFFPEAAEMVRGIDSTRMIMNQFNGFKDMKDSMYTHVDWLVKYGKRTDTDMPFVICEYSHAAGNSCGNLKDYWDAINKYRNLQGGFIWEYADQGLRAETKVAEQRWPRANGRYWANAANGVVTSDRKPTPQLPEVKYCYQTVNVLAVDAAKGEFDVTNRAFFTSLAAFNCGWTCEDDGKVVASGSLGRLDVPPQGGRRVTLKAPAAKPGVGMRTWNFSFKVAAKTPFCEKGWEMARDQVVAFDKSTAVSPLVGKNVPAVKDAGDAFAVASGAAEWTVSKKNGALLSWKVRGKERLAAPLEPSFWRAPTSNGEGSGLSGKQRKPWREAAVHRKVTDVKAGNGKIEFAFAFPDAKDTTGRLAYSFADDACRVEFELRPEGKDLIAPPRFGLTCQVPRAFERVTWFGRGPHESYSDRMAAAFYGRYTAVADDLFFAYAVPQENGNRMDTRELEIAAANGEAIRVKGCPKFDFSLQPCTMEELADGWNPHYFKPGATRTLDIDFGQSGLAGEMTWGEGGVPWAQHRLPTGKGQVLKYAFELR